MTYSHCYYITAGSLVHECIRVNAFDCCCSRTFLLISYDNPRQPSYRLPEVHPYGASDELPEALTDAYRESVSGKLGV
jgi:hypothetical protein